MCTRILWKWCTHLCKYLFVILLFWFSWSCLSNQWWRFVGATRKGVVFEMKKFLIKRSISCLICWRNDMCLQRLTRVGVMQWTHYSCIARKQRPTKGNTRVVVVKNRLENNRGWVDKGLVVPSVFTLMVCMEWTLVCFHKACGPILVWN